MAEPTSWLDKEVDTDVMLMVQDSIGQDVNTLGRKLKITEARLDYAELECKYGVKEKAMQILRAWKNREVQAATVGVLLSHLRSMERNDIVQLIEASFQEIVDEEKNLRLQAERQLSNSKPETNANELMDPVKYLSLSTMPARKSEMNSTWQVTKQSVVLPTGTKFSIAMCISDGSNVILEMLQASHGPVVALFTTDDVDFCIQIDNRTCERGIKFQLTINKQTHSFCLSPKSQATLKALETNGRKLHFRSQETSEGQMIVAQTATKHEISYNEAAEMCCKLHFDIEVEKQAGQSEVEDPTHSGTAPNLDRNPICPEKGKKSFILVKMLRGNRVGFEVDLHDTVESLKVKISEKDPISPKHMRLLFAGKQLADDYPLWQYGITRDSELHLVLRLKGGTKPTCELITETSEPPSSENVGDRGVICYGEKSDQVFGFKYFKADRNFKIEPFVVELRMAPRYAAV